MTRILGPTISGKVRKRRLGRAMLIAASLAVLGRSGYWGASVPFSVFRWGMWVLVGVMTLSALANLVSSSAWERFPMGPAGIQLALLCPIVALGDRGSTP